MPRPRITGPKPISEADWQRTVIAMARALGWLVAHFRPGMNQRGRWMTAVAGDGVGFPDLVLCHRRTHRVLFVELKRDDGKLTPAQSEWLEALGGEVWRPKDFEAARKKLGSAERIAA